MAEQKNTPDVSPARMRKAFGDSYPCYACKRHERCVNLCTRFKKWFFAEWPKTTAMLIVRKP